MMEDWTSGYVADIGYTYGYYPELNPVAARFALLVAGFVPPTVGTACELGFGQGVSVNMHAAASSTHWFGTDFNPSQAAFAQELAAASGAKASLFDEAFGEFCARSDVPEMDYIGLHGIWSWISDENRRVIVDFVRRKLKVGGILYVSYNTQPGWAAAAPLRELMTDHADTMGAQGQGIVSRIDAALKFTEKLLESNPRYVQANPQVRERLKRIMAQDRHYVAHEFFNRDWEPMSFAKFSNWFSQAKVGFACPASFLEHLDPLNLTAEQQALIKEIPDPRFRQTVRDFCMNSQFRRDYWIRGARPLAGAAHRAAMDQQRVVLTKLPQAITLKVGDVNLSEAIYNPVIEALADNKPRAIGDIIRTLVGKRTITLAQLLQALVVLTGKGDLQPAQAPEAADAAKATAARLNKHVTNLSRNSAMVQYLASPVTGGGFAVPRFDQLFLDAMSAGQTSVDGWVRHAWQELSRQGQVLSKNGKLVPGEKENIEILTTYAKEFGEKRLNAYRGLGIA
jgi:SAM-dependent methyltransferase